MSDQKSNWREQIKQSLAECRQWEAARILRLMGRGQPDGKTRERIEALLKEGQEALAYRQGLVPALSYPESLPVSERAEDIRSLLEQHQVVIVAGETGSGKTTQLPKMALEAGRGRRGLVGHTQPRRIAARTVAQRLAEEMQSRVGETVGYQVRFSEQTSEDSLVKVMTDGILLNELTHDRLLDRYDTIIVDEAHERSLNIDFLLGALKRILPKRPDLKVIITSATIELDRFSAYFDDAPVLEVSGRTYPVEVRYRPLADSEDPESGWPGAIESIVHEIEDYEKDQSKAPGDILVFLPGERDIRQVSTALRHADLKHTEVLPLYARLSNQEQNRVFQPHGGRRIVLATNVAETSLTVPGIHYVIDTGLARLSRYSVRSKMQRLPVEPIAQASAEQRKGRCGRVAPGLCFRLYDETDFLNRPEFTDPEIRRTNLASVILQMTNMGLGDVKRFPFIDPPDKRLVNDGYKLLEELGAVDHSRKVTKAGRRMARLPVDPRLARMLLTAEREGSLSEVAVVAAGLSIQDPREHPGDKQTQADQAHALFRDNHSDFNSLLNLWNAWEEQRQSLSGNQLQKWCRKHFVAFLRMREWRDIHRQILLLAREQGMRVNQRPADYGAVHRALLSGLLGNVALKEEKGWFHGTRNRKFRIFPGSALAKKPPKWIMAAEIVETSQVFARMVAGIEVEWIEPLAEHVVRRNHAEPHWEKKRAQVMAMESVTLYGLTIVANRRVGYARIDPELCREIFIRRALVEGEYRTKAPFVVANRELVAEVTELEDKVRRRDLLVDEETLFQFYHERLPPDIVSGKHFEKWWKRLSDDELNRFYLTESDVFQKEPGTDTASLYPDTLEWHGLAFELRYHFEPGTAEDGVSIRVPLMALKQLPVERLGWLVPGLLRDRAIALVKSLPKSLRRNFVPVPDFVDAALSNLTFCNEPLTRKLGEQLQRMTGVRVPVEDWSPQSLPDHLRMNVQVIDEKGNILDQGRDVETLITRHESDAHQALQTAMQNEPETSDSETVDTDWPGGKLPESVETEQGGMQVRVYPVLADEGQGVRQTQVLDPVRAWYLNRRGIARILVNRLGNTLRDLDRRLPGFHDASLLFAPVGRKAELLDDLLIATAQSHFLVDEALPRSEQALQACLEAGRSGFVPALEANSQLLLQIMERYHKVMKGLKGKIPLNVAQSMADLKFQMNQLICPGFMAQTPPEWLKHFPRYMDAALIRLDKMPREAGRERAFLNEFQPFWDRYVERREVLAVQGIEDDALITYRWMLEEYRVSYFAQQLGTAVTVSPQRLERQWQQVRR
ncbi:ATP-dependent RNA helicase HrpA [Salicola sp. Rm-C-2C1-2]|uniref:ATP-dependent RNA helicase HrpA n=1 Tax=Salicola sp. Rm-C-2C1-2 TaxID=3141321 RepID=UPI0032E459E7